MPTNMENLADEIRKIQDWPVKSLANLRKEFREFELSVNTDRYTYIAKIVAAYYKIKDDPVEKSEFVAICVERGHSENILKKDLLLSVFKYTLKAGKKGPAYERARIYARAMQALVEAETDPAHIPRKITEANGIEELYSQHRMKLSAEKAGEGKDESEVGCKDAEVDDDYGDSDDDGDIGDDDNDPSPLKPPSASKKFKISFNPHKDLKVSCEDERVLAEFLESKQRRAILNVELEYRDDEPVRVILRDFTFE